MILWLLTTLFACDRDDFYAEPSLYENIKEVYEDCSVERIGFMKKKNNIQTLFEDCGSNNINDFSWSPDGSLVYFQLFTGAFIMSPENRGVDDIPIGEPVAKGIWMHQGLLAIPVAHPTDRTQNPNLVLYFTGGMLESHPIPGTKPQDTQRYKDGVTLLTIIDDSGKRRPYFFDTKTKEFKRAFVFLDQVDNIETAATIDLLSYKDDKGVHLTKLDGTSIRAFPKGLRGVPHREGKYFALEVDGEPLPFLQTQSLTYKTPEARAREEARLKKKTAELPSWIPKEFIPKELHIVNLENNNRYRMLNVYGYKFDWYPARNYYSSFYLLGIDKQHINNNIALMDLGIMLLMADSGDMPSSMELITE